MKKTGVQAALALALLVFSAVSAAAQPRTGWSTQVDGLAVSQGSAGLSGGGSFSATRSFLRASALYRFDSGTSVGLSASFGRFDYSFSAAAVQPWEDIRDIRLSMPIRFDLGQTTSVFLSPQIRWDYQSGARSSDGRTYGVFAGVAFRLNNRLTIGPAFGAFSQLEDSGTDVFPALLVDWKIDDRWSLSTSSGLGATQGPGLTLRYAVNDRVSLALTARSERVRFRLDGTGLAPNGVGEDRSVPVVISLAYDPNPGVSLSAFVGAEFNGQLTLDNANGAEISRQSYETAPIAGLAFRLRF